MAVKVRLGPRARAVGMVLVGMGMGAMLISPASAHFLDKIPHLRQHMDNFFLTPAEGDNQYLGENQKAADSDKLDGLDSTAFVTSTTGKAADADKLDGINSTGFLLVAGKAADADKLDNIDSASFHQGTTVLSGIRSCPGAGFDPEMGGTAYTTSTSGLRGGAADTYRCAIDLPNGATVTSVTFTVSDPAPVGGVTACTLTRTDLSPAIGTEAATGFVAGPVASTAIDDTVITAALVAGNTTIANGTIGYSLECTLDATSGIYGGVVSYTVPASAG